MNDVVSAEPDHYIKMFQALVKDPANPRSPLWISWHFLQVYSHWGLQIPYTENALALQLGTKQPGSFGFFGGAVTAYASVHTTCEHFLNTVFPKVIRLGNDLNTFAKDSGDAGGLLSTVADLVDSTEPADKDAALELLADLRKDAERNEKNAVDVGLELAAYKSKLITAYGLLVEVDKAVEADSKTSQATIEKISSTDPEAAGSLASIRKWITTYTDSYKQNVINAATTPTYAWVFWPFPPIPIGLIAAIAVASIFGPKAREDLANLHKWQDDLEKANQDLRNAVTAHAVQQTAHAGLAGAQSYTDTAISHTTTVQNAWNGLAAQVKTLEASVKAMTRDDNAALSAKSTIKAYIRRAQAAWAAITPPLGDLMDKPYITISEDKPTTFQGMLQDLADKGLI